MSALHFTINGQPCAVEVDDDTPLLWILRDSLGMTGTKFGCGVGVCGSCTVLENGKAVRSCQIPAREAKDRSFATIEVFHPRGVIRASGRPGWKKMSPNADSASRERFSAPALCSASIPIRAIK